MNTAKAISPRSPMVGLMAVAGLLVVLQSGPAPAAPAAEGLSWSSPVMLSPQNLSSWFPDIFADRAGRVHVVWSAGLATGPGRSFDAVLYRSSLDGADWTPSIDIAALPSKGAVTRASLLVDPAGWFHLTYRSYTVFYGRAPITDVRAARLLPAETVSSPDVGYFSRLARDSRGRLHLVYTENAFLAGCTGCFHAYHRWSDDQGATWSAPVDISPVPTGVAKPQIVVDAHDDVHVVLELGRGGDLGQVPDPAAAAYVVSRDRGATWGTPRTFAPADVSTRNIALGLDRAGGLVASWLLADPHNDLVYFSRSADGGRTWSDPEPIPGVWGGWALYQGKTDSYTMATDSAGAVYLVLAGRVQPTAETLSLLCLRWDGRAWSAPQAIVTLSGDVPEWPRLAVGGGNELNLAWFVRNKAGIFGDDRQYSVWYARARSAAPAVPALAWPAVGPTPQATGTPAAAPPAGPSATPARRMAGEPTPQPVEPYRESDYLRIAAVSLGPALALVVVVFAVNRLRRR